MPLGPLTDEHCAFITGSVSVIVGSRGSTLQPSVMRAVGVRLLEDESALKIYLERSRSRTLLDHVAAHGHVAVVFSRPTTHETLQVKSRHARLASDIDDADWAAIVHYGPRLAAEIASLGFSAAFCGALLACQREDAVALWLQPEAVYDQTPGPVAGRRLDHAPPP